MVDPGFSKGGGGGHKLMDTSYAHTFLFTKPPKGGRWSIIVLLHKDLFFFVFHAILPLFEQNYPSTLSFPGNFQSKTSQNLVTRTFLYTYIFISFHFLETTPTSNTKGGRGILHMMHINFPMGPRPNAPPP